MHMIQDLQDMRPAAPLQTQQINKKAVQQSAIFAKLRKNLGKNLPTCAKF